MKVAVSIPDPLFKRAESLARKLKKPRSRLYAEALASYISSHDPKAITKNLNQVYSRHSSAVDSAIEKAQSEILPDETW
jgi:metal-responsive CopG/Arc/MetJ family transcriptional regulator